MNKVLIILNHQPTIPPFMLSAINCAKDRYDEVHYINTKYPIFSDKYAHIANVHFHYPTKIDRYFAIFRSLFVFFNPLTLSNIWKCTKEKGFRVRYIKSFLVGLSADQCIRKLAEKLIVPHRGENITVLSTWYSACALSAALLKKKYKDITATSLAHSFEILQSRNPLLRYEYIDFKHQHLDGIYFIADTMRKSYLDGIGEQPDNISKKLHVCYLGSYKKYPLLNISDPNIFNICTCSRVIPLKRLSLLLDALKLWKEGPLRWTHMGDGPLLAELRTKAKIVMEDNPLVEIVFRGFVPNNEVEYYYAHNPVDIFVNLSNIEGIPISIMEAISYGIPVIATDVGGTKEIVSTAVGTLLSENITPEIVYQALRDFFLSPLEIKLLLRESAYKSWQSKFNAVDNLNKLFDSIDQLELNDAELCL